MTSQTNIAPPDLAPLLGDPHPLLAQMGGAGELPSPALATVGVQLQRVRLLPALRSFLEAYQAELLILVELPAILRAHTHTVRHEPRELIALDQQLARAPKLKEFAAASCHVGQRQISRLRALRDHRVVQRYLAAVEHGDAHGWHTVVYGLSLGVFSLPLRQGLVGYARHTLGGFIESAVGPLALTADQCRELYENAGAGVPEAVQALLQPAGQNVLSLVSTVARRG